MGMGFETIAPELASAIVFMSRLNRFPLFVHSPTFTPSPIYVTDRDVLSGSVEQLATLLAKEGRGIQPCDLMERFPYDPPVTRIVSDFVRICALDHTECFILPDVMRNEKRYVIGLRKIPGVRGTKIRFPQRAA